MKLSKILDDLKIIAKLPDEPNDVGGLTAAELKAKFDEAGEALKAYLNNTLTSELDISLTGLETKDSALQSQIDQLVTGTVPDGSITEAKLANGAVTHAKLGLNAVEGANIKTGAVGNNALAAKAVGTANIADNAVTETKLGGNSVSQRALAPDSVWAGNIKDGAITANKLGDDAVTAKKIGAGAVQYRNMSAGAVHSDTLDASAKALFQKPYTISREDLTDGVSALADGELYLVY